MQTNSKGNIANFVRYSRSRLKMTQVDLSEKAGVGLRFIRELEQGKQTLRVDKVNQVLQLFGYTLSPSPIRKIDPYEILLQYLNKSVRIQFKNKTELTGFIVEAITEGMEVKAWKFLSGNNYLKYQKSKDQELVKVINHSDLQNIGNV
ncbi:helix-turn-helix transcriptional regulator [Segetibacter aerophilus]|uniref:HTH cro/C1-type domain-containing protein n=1 Tax=Segetibacter aerophilus TaxID=670293 RepID=A0A512BJS7_9BACT|nr:helix-turn-helix transcriptional regulator [Segetibacter aerophilus]GEO12219.1 hypothetical protein SAE01_47150 [Segetibacter aerophilus]